MTKIKDLKDRKNLINIKVKTPSGTIGYWKGQWQKGVWLSDGKTNRVYPYFIDDLKECLEWEVIDEK